jgi:hypothetical protein
MKSKSEDKPALQERVSKDIADGEIVKPGDALADDEELTIALANYVPDTAEERRLVRKIDFTLLPCLWWMYVLAYLDRGNIVSFEINRWRDKQRLTRTGKCQCSWNE